MLSKDTINKIVNKIADVSETVIGSRYNAGVVVATIHLIIVALILYLFFLSVSNVGFLLGFIGVIIIIILHVLFNGCFLLKVERVLFNDKKWYNFWNLVIFPLEKIGIDLTKDRIYKIVTVVDIIILYIAYVKFKARFF